MGSDSSSDCDCDMLVTIDLLCNARISMGPICHMGTPVIAHCLIVAITLSYSKQVDSWTHEIAGAPGVPREGLAMLVSRPAQNLQFVVQKRHHGSNLNDGCNPSQGEIC